MRLFKPNVPKMQGKKDVAGLIKALSDQDSVIRSQAARALGQIGDRQALSPLIAGLKDDDWTVRRVDEVIQISNNIVPYVVPLGLDHIHSYTSNPGRGMGHGFLQLRVQLCLRGNDIDIEPLPPGQWK